MKSTMKKYLIVLSIFLTVFSQNEKQSYFEKSSAEAEGLDQAVLDNINQEIKDGVYGLIDHFLVIRNGKIVFNQSYEQDYEAIAANYDTTNYQYNYDHPDWHPFYKNTKLHSMQSVTKSVTSAIMGIAMDKGLLPDVKTKAMKQFFPENFERLDSRKQAMTIQDVLTMRTGLAWDESNYLGNANNDCILMEKSEDWIKYVVDKEMSEAPGKRFNYNSGASVLLGKMIRNGTGKRIDHFAEEFLFGPLGITDYYWKVTAKGEIDTEGGLYLTSIDLAKIGFLFMNQGLWDGKVIISKEWIQESTKPHIAHVNPNNKNSQGYGYQWWLPKHDGEKAEIIAGNGYGGQFLFVVPAKNLIVVLNGWNQHKRPKKFSFNILQRRLLPSLKN